MTTRFDGIGHTRLAARLAILAVACCWVSSSRGDDLSDQAQSLRMVPKDSAYYAASLRLQEQWDIFLDSNAYEKLTKIPLIQFAIAQIEAQWQQAAFPQVRQIRDYVESIEGQEALGVLKEMFAEEVFVYGGKDISDWLELLVELNQMQQSARLDAEANDENVDDLLQQKILQTFQERADGFAVPTIVMGFRIKDADQAEAQLDVIQATLRNLLDEKYPELAANLQRDQIAGREFLTLRVDGSMIPWEQLREEAADLTPEQFEAWRELISKKTFAVALGVVDRFVLLSVGASTDHLETIGQGPVMAEHEAIERLAPHAGERVVSISYLSADLAEDLSSPERTRSDLSNSLDAAMREAEIDDSQRQQILDDIEALNLNRFMPTPGETSVIAFLTERGYEGFQYQTGEQPMMDSTRPLAILSHVGGSPLLLVASASNDTVKDYDALAEWVKTTAGHVEAIAQSKATPEDWKEYLKHRDRVVELLTRFSNATREYIYPALEKNQGALVLSASAESKQWTTHAPKSPTPLPMIELGMVMSVSDAEKLRKGVREYCAVLREGIELAREIRPNDIPEFELPKADKRDSETGDLFVFSLPEEWGIDDQISPTAALSEDTAVLTTMPATAKSLLEKTPLEIDTALDLKRPAAMIMHVEFAKSLEVIRPWIDYGVAVAMGTLKREKSAEAKDDEASDADEEAADDDAAQPPNPVMMQIGLVLPQFYELLDVAAAVRSVTSVTYEDNGVWVTHSETHIQDLDDDDDE